MKTPRGLDAARERVCIGQEQSGARIMSYSSLRDFIDHLEKEEDGVNKEEQTVALIAAAVKHFKESRLQIESKKTKKASNWKIQGRIKSFTNGM